MADTQEAPAEINLKVLSPSTEVQGDICLLDIPTSTTVKDLRLKIQNEIATRPATDRMRLIYRGRVVPNESQTLIDVFGIETLRSSKDHTLHLVLRELHPSSTVSSPGPPPNQRASPLPPNPFRTGPPPMPPGGLPTNPFRLMNLPRPNSQPQAQGHAHAHAHHLHHHHHHHLPQQPASRSPAVPNLLQPQGPQGPGQQNTANSNPQDQQSRNGSPATNASDGGHHHPPTIPLPPGILPPNTTRTIRTESLGPNGERVTVTWNNANITIPGTGFQHPILPRPFPHTPGLPHPIRLAPTVPGASVDQLLARARVGLQTARQEMDNVRVLLHGPDGQQLTSVPPPWRLEHIAHHMRSLNQGLEQVQQGLALLATDPSMSNNRDVLSLQQAASGLRGHALDINAMFEGMRAAGAQNEGQPPSNATSNTAPSSIPGMTTSNTGLTAQMAQSGGNTNTQDRRPELYLLSSPQGPVGILFDQRGTYSTAPIAPLNAFAQQFTTNRQLLAGIGQQVTHTSHQLPNPLAAGQPAQPAQGAANTQPAANPQDHQNHNQNANQAQPQPQAQGQQNPEQAQNGGLGGWAGVGWLIFKLAAILYVFGGHGGWYRPILLSALVIIAYLFQTGMFEQQVNAMRQHFEALLPLPQPPNAANAGNANGNAAAQGQGQAVAGNRRAPTPEDAARRLIREREEARVGGLRQVMQTGERAFALFVASLWPGVGERMVRAQEERERVEREAREAREAEERRQEEERVKREEEAEKINREFWEGEADVAGAVEREGDHGKGKGKERAVDVAGDEKDAVAGPSS